MTPDHPVVRGTAQNPDVYFQARESVNPFYAKSPEIVQQAMDKLGERTGRYYKLYEYHGAEDADKVIVIMGSGSDAVQKTVDFLNETTTTKLGVLKVRLYRPFDASRLVAALPKTVKRIAVLDRTKEPGSLGEPLYLEVVTAISECWQEYLNSFPKVVGGRYGLSSKEFNPAMIKGIFDNLDRQQPQNHFTVGINDDLSNTSLTFDRNLSIEPDSVFRLKSAPATFKAIAARDKDFKGQNFSLQVAPEDCTGCAVCIDVCPAQDKLVTSLLNNPQKSEADIYQQREDVAQLKQQLKLILPTYLDKVLLNK